MPLPPRLATLIMGSLTLIVSLTSPSRADYFSFYGESCGGSASGTMELSLTGYTLNITINNTSDTHLLNGNLGNTPGITGFGFNIDPDVWSLDSITWTLKAINSENNTFETIGSNDPTDPVTVSDGRWEFTHLQENEKWQGMTLDFVPNTAGTGGKGKNGNGGGVSGALYNPLADTIAGFDGAGKAYFFTTALLQVTFDDHINGSPVGPPTLDYTTSTPMLRFQTVGDGGSVKAFGQQSEPVPAPSALVLVVMGMASVGSCHRFSQFMAKRKSTQAS